MAGCVRNRTSLHMKRLKLACWVVGVALTAWLVHDVGVSAVGTALRTVGWIGLLAISGFHLIATILMGFACWQLRQVGTLRLFVWARLLRDAGSEVLPFSQVGGYVLGARTLIIHGISAAGATASVLVDAALEFSAQIAYIALGVGLLTWRSPGSTLAAPALVELSLAVPAALGFIALQRRGSDLLARATARLTHAWLDDIRASAAAVQSEIRRIYEVKPRLWRSFLLHLIAWILCGVEAWLALRLMGTTLSLSVVLALESLIYAARAVAFLVPNAAGVQEGAYILVGGALGLPPDLALSLSLLKRGRDLSLALPAVIAWQLYEAKGQVAVGETARQKSSR